MTNSIALPQELMTAGTIESARRHLLETDDPLPLIMEQWPGVVLDEFQEDAIRAIFSTDTREIYAKGATATGKSGGVGLGVCAYFYAYEDARVVLTSTTFAHVQAVLFAEVSKWYRRMKIKPHGARLLAAGISHTEEHYVECVNPAAGEAFSGRHGRHTLFVFDEATGIADERYKLADTQATKFVALANPRTLSGRFRLAFSPCQDKNKTETVLASYGYRLCMTIDGSDCLNVREKRLEHPVGPIGGIEIEGQHYEQGERIPREHYELVEPIIPGQLCYDTYLGHCANPDTRWVGTFAHGRFPDEDPDVQVVLNSWLDRHIEAWNHQRPAVTCFGLDPADSEHGDETILAAGGPEGCDDLYKRRKANTMETCAWVLRTVENEYGIDLTQGDHAVVVDADGVGKGIADRLAELGVKVIYYRGNEAAEEKKRYVNRRAEGHGALGERLDPEGTYGATPWALPPDSLLRQDLCAPERVFDSDGFRFKITPKTRHHGMPDKVATLTEKLGRSPDRGDAAVYLHWGVRNADHVASEGLSMADVRRACRLEGPATAEAAGKYTYGVAAIWQRELKDRLAMVVLGVDPKSRKLGLLLCKEWPGDASRESIVSDIVMQCRRLQAGAVAFDPIRSSALVASLARQGLKSIPCPHTLAIRRLMGHYIMDWFRGDGIDLYSDEELERQLARLPITSKPEGYVLGEVEATGVRMERAAALVMGVLSACESLRAHQNRR